MRTIHLNNPFIPPFEVTRCSAADRTLWITLKNTDYSFAQLAEWFENATNTEIITQDRDGAVTTFTGYTVLSQILKYEYGISLALEKTDSQN